MASDGFSPLRRQYAAMEETLRQENLERRAETEKLNTRLAVAEAELKCLASGESSEAARLDDNQLSAPGPSPQRFRSLSPLSNPESPSGECMCGASTPYPRAEPGDNTTSNQQAKPFTVAPNVEPRAQAGNQSPEYEAEDNDNDEVIVMEIREKMDSTMRAAPKDKEVEAVCQAAFNAGVQNWVVRKLTEDERMKLLKVITSIENIHQLSMEGCTTAAKGKSCWPPIVKQAFGSENLSADKIQELVSWLAGAAKHNKPFRTLLEGLDEGHKQHCQLAKCKKATD